VEMTLLAGTINVRLDGSVGFMVAPRAASTQLPNPITDFVDWYWQYNYDTRDNEAEPRKTNVDIRTARKVRGIDRTLFMKLQSSVGSGGSIVFGISARMLIGYP